MKGRGTFILSSFALSVVLAGAAALVLSSSQDKALRREIARYEAVYPELKADIDLESDVVENLNRRDGAIYTGLFLTDPPSADALTAADLIADSDSLSDSFYLNYSAQKSERMMKMASQVDSTFAEIFRLLQQRADSIPPLTLPLKDMSYAQTGASLGEKQNPFHKKTVQHEGLDIVAPRGTLVWCTAPGVVASVENTRTGLGLMVTVRHPGGFQTRYAQLGDTFVETGKKVKMGEAIGRVGVMPGFAPHLHYEVLYHGVPQDPVNHIFASVSPEDYARMLYISGSTLQSMD